MKGLVIKDIMCLRKQLTMFAYVMVGVIVVSVMYVHSAKFGNVSMAAKEMMLDNDMTMIDVKNLGSMALVLFMLLPIAVIGDMVNVFQADGKAGFHKVERSLPLSVKKCILAKYISVFALFGMGVSLDVLIAGVLSCLTDLLTFGEFLGVIFSAASLMSIYSVLVIFFHMILGYGKESYAQIFSLLTMGVAAFVFNLKKIWMFFTTDFSTGDMAGEINLWWMLDFIKEKAWMLVLIAVFVSVLSYLGSCLVAERKRGVN